MEGPRDDKDPSTFVSMFLTLFSTHHNLIDYFISAYYTIKLYKWHADKGLLANPRDSDGTGRETRAKYQLLRELERELHLITVDIWRDLGDDAVTPRAAVLDRRRIFASPDRQRPVADHDRSDPKRHKQHVKVHHPAAFRTP